MHKRKREIEWLSSDACIDSNIYIQTDTRQLFTQAIISCAQYEFFVFPFMSYSLAFAFERMGKRKMNNEHIENYLYNLMGSFECCSFHSLDSIAIEKEREKERAIFVWMNLQQKWRNLTFRKSRKYSNRPASTVRTQLRILYVRSPCWLFLQLSTYTCLIPFSFLNGIRSLSFKRWITCRLVASFITWIECNETCPFFLVLCSSSSDGIFSTFDPINVANNSFFSSRWS